MPSIEFKGLDVIQGFKSFDKAQSFSFDDLKPGFYFITGENRVEEKLGANGAGKSTIWDALCWALFERTPTKLKASDVHCWGSNTKTQVCLRMEVDGTSYLLTRTWNPNKLLLSEEGEAAKTITNDDVVSLIGFDLDAFLYSVLISQFSSKFFDLMPSEKMGVFSSVMESALACWLGYSEKAKAKRTRVEAAIKEWEGKVSNIEGQITSLEAQQFTLQIKEWEKEKGDSLADIEEDISENKAQQRTNETKALAYGRKAEKLDDKRASICAKITKLKASTAVIWEEEKDAQNIRADIEAEQRTLVSSQKKLDGLEGECPTCLQAIDGKVLKKEVSRIQAELHDLDSQKDEVIDVLEEIVERIQEADTKMDALREKKQEVNNDFTKEEADEKNCNRVLRVLKQTEGNLQGDYDDWMEKENPYEKLEGEKDDKIKRLKQNKTETERALALDESNYQVYNYWVGGFKDIRYMILAEALHELEIQINNSLDRLGLDSWEIILAVDKATKKGTVTKGFTVFIKSPGNDELVPFESWSGGERQRLRLAGTLGMMDFISDRMGFKTNIEIFDEPTTWLSETGIEDLLEILSDRAKETSKKLFIIDHRDFHTFGGFDGSIKVIKDEGGSRIEIEEGEL